MFFKKSPQTRWFALTALSVVIAGTALSPWIFEQADMSGCWLPWARATKGYLPWNAYTLATCNYPPFMLYVLTVVEAVVRLTSRSPWGAAAVTLVKLPSIIACVGGAYACFAGLRRIAGENPATSIAFLYLLCPPLLFNAVLWGQFDAILCLAMVTAIIALMNDRPLLSGALVGWALSIKLQAIVIIPVVCVYVLRKQGCLKLLQSGGMAAVVVAAIAAPMVIGGQGRASRLAYTGAVDYFPFLSNDAFNLWALVKQCNIHILHLADARSMNDSVHMLGALSAKHIGMLAFSGYVLFLITGLSLRPTADHAALASGMSAFAFFMLLTQMHERYSIPAVALLTLCVFSKSGKVYLCVMIPSFINQVKSLISENYGYRHHTTPAMQQCFDCITVVVSLANAVAFIYATGAYYRQVYRAQDPGTQHPGTQHPGTQHPGTQHPGTQHLGTQHLGTQHPVEGAELLAAKSQS
jgi:Gpi18-like mannosyltransferase